MSRRTPESNLPVINVLIKVRLPRTTCVFPCTFCACFCSHILFWSLWIFILCLWFNLVNLVLVCSLVNLFPSNFYFVALAIGTMKTLLQLLGLLPLLVGPDSVLIITQINLKTQGKAVFLTSWLNLLHFCRTRRRSSYVQPAVASSHAGFGGGFFNDFFLLSTFPDAGT